MTGVKGKTAPDKVKQIRKILFKAIAIEEKEGRPELGLSSTWPKQEFLRTEKEKRVS